MSPGPGRCMSMYEFHRQIACTMMSAYAAFLG
jgi:hypothetical protein